VSGSLSVGIKPRVEKMERQEDKGLVANSPVKNALGERLRGSNATATVKLVAGMAGGLAEALLLQPLDVAKTRLQLDKEKKYKGMFDCLKKVSQEEGTRALYKGLTPFVTHLTLKYALRFGLFEKIRVILNGGKTSASSNGQNFIAGMAVGCIEATMIVTPFEVVKTRLQKQKGNKDLKYKGPIDVVIKVTREEGLRRLWSGNIPTVIRQGSNQAFNFMSMQILNDMLWGKKQGDGKTLEVWKTLLNGLLAGAVGPCFNAPVDVIKNSNDGSNLCPRRTCKIQKLVPGRIFDCSRRGCQSSLEGYHPKINSSCTWSSDNMGYRYASNLLV